MWLAFPNGCSGISVDHLEYSVEVRDESGIGYCRVPEHLAPRLLNIPGFSIGNPPEGAPADLPKSDPLRDDVIATLSAQIEAQKREIQDIRSDLIAANSRIQGLVAEKTEREKEIEKLRVDLAAMQLDIDEIAPAEIVPLRKAK